MALTTEQIDSAYRKVWSTVPHAQRLSAFALEIEAEVRKDDTELIHQLVASLEGYRRNHNDNQPCDAEREGRAWLVNKRKDSDGQQD